MVRAYHLNLNDSILIHLLTGFQFFIKHQVDLEAIALKAVHSSGHTLGGSCIFQISRRIIHLGRHPASTLFRIIISYFRLHFCRGLFANALGGESSDTTHNYSAY